MRPADGALMVYVPGGDFLMGSSEAEIEAELSQCQENYSVCSARFYTSESPQHPVTLDGFWMDQTEVTNAQYTAFLNEYGNMGENKATFVIFNESYCRIRQVDDAYEVSDKSADHPVVMVTRHGAEAYCKSVGAQLPTEAQWEYAARGPEGNIYPWGDDPPTRELTQFGSGTTAPVGSHPEGASWCGVHDMAGNVWEWVADWHGRYPSGAQVNPTGPSSGGLAVSRGGGWHSPQREVRSAFRLYDTPPSGYNG
jgi:formylglycine-generating enzyme required for sulfatase activity